MINVNELKFDEKGLIPAIVVDAKSKEVLTLAYMNEESLRITMEERRTCFWSRSRKKLWRKGETSGNVQHVVSITADCDKDALVVKVEKVGPACHTGAESCFFSPLYIDEERHEFSLRGLYDLLMQRKTDRPEGSYTTYLCEKGPDIALKWYFEWELAHLEAIGAVPSTDTVEAYGYFAKRCAEDENIN